MRKAKYRWQMPQKEAPSQEFIDSLAPYKLSKLAGELLWQRGIHSPEALRLFIEPDLADLHDPFLMFDMDRAVERIQQAIMNGEHILVYGDYDADGITSTTIMKETLELLGGNVEYVVPNRFLHGYGPNQELYASKINEGVTLIITVDNGVAGHEAIAFAQEQGIDVIVTDHHELPNELPEAFAIVHPRHPKGNYPFGDLAGVGVAFKVATALLEEAPIEFLDLVAIGTVADLVSLTGENRTLVKLGLQAIKVSERMGLTSLIQTSGLKDAASSTGVGFTLAPRLNAIGRLGDPTPAVELLSTFDEQEAQKLAQLLEEKNNQRKEIVETITTEALQMIHPEDPIHILAKENWHEGVLGIVAGKIMQETGSPALVLSLKEDGTAKGSGRSVEAVNLYQLLSTEKELFLNFGGHHAAVGLTLPAENLPILKERLFRWLKENQIDLSEGPSLAIDEIIEADQINVPFIQELQVLAPFGTDNPEPLFLFKENQASQLKQLGPQRQHLKFVFGTQLDVIAFQFGSDLSEFQDSPVEIVGKLSINEWNGIKKAQVMLEDFQVTGSQLFDWRVKAKRDVQQWGEHTLVIRFSTKQRSQWSVAITDFETLEQIDIIVKTNGIEEIAFLDCPQQKDLIKEIVALHDFNRVYCLFDSAEEAYLNGLGTREQYARLFAFIAQQQQVDVRYKLPVVAKHLDIPEKLLIFMIRVFFDLGFVTIVDGVMSKIEEPINHPLTDSAIYQERIAQIKSEEFLLLSSIAEIKSWLNM